MIDESIREVFQQLLSPLPQGVGVMCKEEYGMVIDYDEANDQYEIVNRDGQTIPVTAAGQKPVPATNRTCSVCQSGKQWGEENVECTIDRNGFHEIVVGHFHPHFLRTRQMDVNKLTDEEQLEAIEGLLSEVMLPLRSPKLVEIYEALSAKMPSVSKITKLVEEEEDLPEALMNIIKLPAFAVKGDVKSVQTTIMIIGLEKVTPILLSAALRKNIERQPAHKQAFTKQVDQKASLAASIAEMVNDDPEFKAHAYMSALFRSCARLIMMQRFDLYEKWFASTLKDTPTDTPRIQQRTYGLNECGVAYYAARQWLISAPLQEATYFSNVNTLPENLEKKSVKLTRILSVVESVITHHALQVGKEPPIAETVTDFLEKALNDLGITREALIERIKQGRDKR